MPKTSHPGKKGLKHQAVLACVIILFTHVIMYRKHRELEGEFEYCMKGAINYTGFSSGLYSPASIAACIACHMKRERSPSYFLCCVHLVALCLRCKYNQQHHQTRTTRIQQCMKEIYIWVLTDWQGCLLYTNSSWYHDCMCSQEHVLMSSCSTQKYNCRQDAVIDLQFCCSYIDSVLMFSVLVSEYWSCRTPSKSSLS